MEFLGADHQVHVGQAVDQFLSPALRHAAHETEHHVGPAAAEFRCQGLHLAKSLFFGRIAHAASVEQDDVGGGLRRRQGVALGDELSGDLFGVALIHLATVRFDIDTRHEVQRKSRLRDGWSSGKRENGEKKFLYSFAVRIKVSPRLNSLNL